MAVKLEVINARIAKIGNGELTFKQELGILSRELPDYVNFGGDIAAVNRLLDVLTPANREKVKEFFMAMLPYSYSQMSGKFDGKNKNPQVIEKRAKALADFLADEDATIWTWLAQKNADKGAANGKPKEYEKKIEALVKKSLEDKDEAINVASILRATIKGGASLAEIMAFIHEMPDIKGDAADKKAA
jgi:hypothetical protein